MNAADDLAVLARVTASLVVVIALAVLAARFARKAGVRGAGAGLRVVERTGLSREASVAVVEVGGRGLVVGVTAQGVSLLTELTAAELAAATSMAATSMPATSMPATSMPATSMPATSMAGTFMPATSMPATSMAGASSMSASAGLPELSERSRRIVVRAEPGVNGSRTGNRADGIRGTGSVLDPRTWRQAVEALRDLTVRRQ